MSADKTIKTPEDVKKRARELFKNNASDCDTFKSVDFDALVLFCLARGHDEDIEEVFDTISMDGGFAVAGGYFVGQAEESALKKAWEWMHSRNFQVEKISFDDFLEEIEEQRD